MALSQCIGVGGCGCPIYCKVSLMILSSFEFRNIAHISASTSDDTTNLSIWHRVNISPLRCMGCLSCGFRPRMKFPSDMLLESRDDK